MRCAQQLFNNLRRRWASNTINSAQIHRDPSHGAVNASHGTKIEPVPTAPEISNDALKLWRLAREQIDISEWKKYEAAVKPGFDRFRVSVAECVLSTLEEVRMEYKVKQWTHIRKDGKKIVFSDVVDDIITCLTSVKDLGSAAVSCDPTHAASVGWAGVQFLVTVRISYHFCNITVTDYYRLL
jgi:hypothetical protein